MPSLRNDYAALVDPALYAETPKEVFAAVAVAFAQRLEGEAEVFRSGVVDRLLLEEWQALFSNGIVSQRPSARKGGAS